MLIAYRAGRWASSPPGPNVIRSPHMRLIGTIGWVIFWTLAILGTAAILLEWHDLQAMAGLVP